MLAQTLGDDDGSIKCSVCSSAVGVKSRECAAVEDTYITGPDIWKEERTSLFPDRHFISSFDDGFDFFSL